jgi:2-hydroxychromene-2-carboxylate isomerase
MSIGRWSLGLAGSKPFFIGEMAKKFAWGNALSQFLQPLLFHLWNDGSDADRDAGVIKISARKGLSERATQGMSYSRNRM